MRSCFPLPVLSTHWIALHSYEKHFHNKNPRILDTLHCRYSAHQLTASTQPILRSSAFLQRLALFSWPRKGTKYPLQSGREIYFQSCLLWAPLDCTFFFFFFTKPEDRSSSICWWHHIGCDSGAAGFLFGEVEVLCTRNPKAKCLVFPCKLTLPLFFTWLHSLLLSPPPLWNLCFWRVHKNASSNLTAIS